MAVARNQSRLALRHRCCRKAFTFWQRDDVIVKITWESTDEYESKHMHTNIMKVLHGDTGNGDYDAGEDEIDDKDDQ